MYTWLFLCSNFLPVGAIASVVALCGGLFIMVGGQEQGFSLISRAGIFPYFKSWDCLYGGSTDSVIYAITCWDC
nr:hypothetical protein [Bacillus cereus]